MLIAHALFKATLFLVVGIVDHSTGTRDLRQLSGVGRRLPVLCRAAVLAAASMAGMPPMLGFVAKEAAFEPLIYRVPAATGRLPLLAGCAGSLGGSALTVAYTLASSGARSPTKPGVPPTPVSCAPPRRRAGRRPGRCWPSAGLVARLPRPGR